MRRELARPGSGMADLVFTAGELDASRRSRWPERHLAMCFAAKEALFKALGTGWAGGLRWQEVELSTAAGGQQLLLSGQARASVEGLGVQSVHVDASCGGELAIAAVLLERAAGGRDGSSESARMT